MKSANQLRQEGDSPATWRASSSHEAEQGCIVRMRVATLCDQCHEEDSTGNCWGLNWWTCMHDRRVVVRR